MTDVGGVQFGDSIEAGTPGETDRVSLLDDASRASLWDAFLGPTPSFDAVGVAQEFTGVRGA